MLLIPGEVFNVDKLKLTEKRLENMGYFKKVNVYAVKTEGCTLPGDYRDVHVEVDETSTGKIRPLLRFFHDGKPLRRGEYVRK